MLFTGIWYYVDLMFYLLGDYVFNLVVMFANIFVIGNMISGWINLQIYIERVVPKKVSNHA